MARTDPQRTGRRAWWRPTTVLGVLLVVVGGSVVPPAPATAAAPTTASIDFTTPSSTVPAGWTADRGAPFDTARGYGWVAGADRTPVDLAAEARQRTGTGVEASFVHLQRPGGSGMVVAGGRWEYALPAGNYAVTVGAGDPGKNADGTPCCLDSVHRLAVEGVPAVVDFQPTATALTTSATVVVAVSDGLLTVDAAGGTNTKIGWLTIARSTARAAAPAARVIGMLPADGRTGVRLDSSVSLVVTRPVDDTTIESAVRLTGPDGDVQLKNVNSDAAGGTVSLTPANNLAANTVYTVRSSTALRGTDGTAFTTYVGRFRTASTSPPTAPFAFTRSASTSVAKPSAMALGPDGKLYVGTYTGQVLRYPRAADGSLGAGESVRPFGNRIITGLTFDPADPTALYVTNNHGVYADAPRSSGKVSRLRLVPGGTLAQASAEDVIIGLPRSRYDHMTNGTAFGPDGRLYIAQGANTAYGDTDAYWGDRGEQPLSAAILVANVRSTTAFPPGTPVNVNTDPPGTPSAPGSAPAVGYRPGSTAPVRVYASGVRNPYALSWGTNGRLYAPVNESADGGNTPVPPSGTPAQLLNLPAYSDYFTRITAGGYYGHPNPSTGHHVLNGANPTAGVDPWEVRQYPVGTRPDPGWRAPDLNLGVHRSANGAAQYLSGRAFGGELEGSYLLTEYSNGDDLLVVTLDDAGRPVGVASAGDAQRPGQRLIFENPLGVVTDPVTGVVYVAEYLGESNLAEGRVSVLTPSRTDPTTPLARVDFTTATGPVAAGYVRDSGAAWSTARGYGWVDEGTRAPLSLVGNGRVRASSASPDQRSDSLLMYQASAASAGAVTARGTWEYAVANGRYQVSVGLGDATATNSTYAVTAERGQDGEKVVLAPWKPSSALKFVSATATVEVVDGRLTLDGVGGTNGKLGWVTIDRIG